MKNFLLKRYYGISAFTWGFVALVGILSIVHPGALAFAGALPMVGGMIYDTRNAFCLKTALNTGGVASYLIGDVIDLGVGFNSALIDRALGNGECMYLNLSVDTACLSATGSVKFHLCSDAQAAIAVDGSATYHLSTGAFAQAGLTAGTTLLSVPLPGGKKYERYLGIVQETITAAFTAGKVNAFLSCDPRGNVIYPDAL